MFVRDRDIAIRYGVSRAWPWRQAARGLLPPPIRFSARMSRWNLDEVIRIEQARSRGATDAEVRRLVQEIIAGRQQ